MDLTVAREGPMPVSGRDPATEKPSFASKEGPAEALELMERALRVIDSFSGAEVVGAHLDLAIHRLREWSEKS